MAVDVTRERFEELVADALDDIPADLAERMDNVVVTVQRWPSPTQQRGHRGTLLGLYEGVALTRRPFRPGGWMKPDRITIFQGPHCRLAADEEALAARVRVTVLHEVAHHFGISDERLVELGWA
jgi:predicted Zn-dependent protease with MMP-like domain